MPIKSPLSDTASKVTGEALQAALTDLIGLALVAKQAHWNLIGPRFRSIHLQLDEIVDVTRRHSDTVAERATTIGVTPDGCADTVARDSRLPEISRSWLPEDEVLRYFVAALAVVVEGMRERIDATAQTDPVSQDLFIAITADLEKEYWMVQATSELG